MCMLRLGAGLSPLECPCGEMTWVWQCWGGRNVVEVAPRGKLLGVVLTEGNAVCVGSWLVLPRVLS